MIGNSQRKYFERPNSAMNYVDLSKVLVGPDDQHQKMEMILPDAGQIRPLSFRTFPEATSQGNAIPNVICGGNVVVIPTLDHVALIARDSEPGKRAMVYRSGTWRLPLDYAGDTGSPARTASNLSGLNGKKAYYIASTGTVTDVEPTFADHEYLYIGRFTERVELKPSVNTSGLWFADVIVDPTIDNSAQPLTAIPTAVAISNTTEFYQSLTASAFVGLGQNLFLSAASSNPNYPIQPHQVTWLIEGAAEYKGFEVSHEFSAGNDKTIAITITDGGGNTATYNYTIDISATVAASGLTQV